MAIQDTDLLLINRAGASYKVAAIDLVDKVQAGDLALVNRSGDSYKLTGNKLTAGTFNDTDLFIINRAGASYQVAGSEIKTLLIPPLPQVVSGQWNFVVKYDSGSIFKMTIGFDGPIDLNQDTTATLELVARKGDSLARLDPVTQEGDTAQYKADNWTATTTPAGRTIAPSFLQVNSQAISFNLFISKFIQLGGQTTQAKGTGLAGQWTGTIGVSQNGVSYTTVTQTFQASSDYFP